MLDYTVIQAGIRTPPQCVVRSSPPSNSVGGEILRFDLSGSTVCLEGGEARLDLKSVRIGLQRGELLIKRRRSDLGLAKCQCFLAAYLLLVASQLGGRIENVNGRDGIMDAVLSSGRLLSGDELIALPYLDRRVLQLFTDFSSIVFQLAYAARSLQNF